MPGRPKIFETDEAIRKATEVFWQKGYEAASTEELLSAMGIGKGSFYLHFKNGKKELYQRSLALFSEDAMVNFYKGLGAAKDEVEYLRNFLLRLCETSVERKQKGCYIGNGIIEMSVLDPGTKDHAAALMHKLEMAFESILSKAQTEGKLKNQINSKVLAKYLINIRNGINVTMRTEKDNKKLREIMEISLQILR